MTSSLEKIRSEIDAVDEDAKSLCAGLTEEQLRWRPQPGRWSIAENLIHLNVTTQSNVPAVQQAISRARGQGLSGQGTFSLGILGTVFSKYLEPPYRLRSKAPTAIEPILQGPATEALPQFLRSQELMRKCVDAAEGIDLGRATFTSPFASFLKMSLIGAFCVSTAHERRHLWAAWKVREALPK